jgi:peptidoglycan/LPS O-acetylase OafA/YrhL
MSVGNGQARIEIVHCLRGLASLGVCWFHLTNGNPSFLNPGPLKSSGAYGWIGVEVFFVISGFILPYAMYSAGYELNTSHYLTFLLKRIVRLDPPYLAAVLLAIIMAYLSYWSPGYRGAPPDIGMIRVFCHIAYLNAFFKYEWLNPVFWSLAIEFQYYLLIGLALPLIASHHRIVRLVTLVCLALLSLLPIGSAFVSHYIFLFVMGMFAFQHRVKVIGTTEALFLLGLAAVGSSLTLGFVLSATGLVTSLIIMFLEWRNSILAFLGDLSYSLYLVHVPVGGRIINLGARFHGNEIARALFLAAALMSSIGIAFLMLKFIEGPSQRWAKAIRFGQPRTSMLLAERTAAGA